MEQQDKKTNWLLPRYVLHYRSWCYRGGLDFCRTYGRAKCSLVRQIFSKRILLN